MSAPDGPHVGPMNLAIKKMLWLCMSPENPVAVNNSRPAGMKKSNGHWPLEWGIEAQIVSVYPGSKVHGAYMGPTWGRQVPGWPQVGPWSLLSG